MRHIIINSYGVSLKLKGNRLIINKLNDDKDIEVPLSRLNSVHLQSGCKLSTDLLLAFTQRGIKTFINGFNYDCSVHSLYEHKSIAVKLHQYKMSDDKRLKLSKAIMIGKIKNQRSTLLYFSRVKDREFAMNYIISLKNIADKLSDATSIDSVLGFEGSAASVYFSALKELGLVADSFKGRHKRFAQDITNHALNYGYAILRNFIYKSIINAGLDPYCGIIHTIQPGRQSLTYDLMEEYRSFLVDRNIIKLRSTLRQSDDFNKIKNLVAKAILDSLSRRLVYKDKKLTLESIIQRQVYRLSGAICDNKNYKSYIFRF